MPRKARLKSITNIYHVVIRGADRQQIFEEEKDYKKYIDILQYYKNECSFELYAYCLMSNHVHLLIYAPTTSLESIFRHINTAYAVWFNMKYSRTGFVQQGRYYSEPVDDLQYLFTVVRYIHHNPYKAGMEKFPGASYAWCSMRDYIEENESLVNVFHILNLMGGTDNFFEFHRKYSSDECLEIDTIRKRIPDDVAKDIIISECNCSTVSDFQALSLYDRNKYILLLHKKGISIRQMNRLTGIPKGVIDRIVTKGRSS